MEGFDIEVDTESTLWENIMNSWLSINMKYINDWYDEYKNYHDCAYWYNERTCVGLLSGAIWKNNGMCLEEYSSIKGELDSNGKINKTIEKYGRTDLYFYLDSDEYIVEAKFLMGRNIDKDKICKTLSLAEDDCRKSSCHESDSVKSMAMVFIVPFKGNDDIDFSLIKENLDVYCSLKKTSKGDILQTRNDNVANSCYVIGKEVEK